MTDLEAEEETGGDVEAPAKRRGRGPVFLAWALAGVFFALAVAMTLVAVSIKGSSDDEAGDRREVESVSTRLGEALLSWDYESPGETRDRVLALGTGHFREQYDEAYPQLQTDLAAVKFRAVAEVQGVWVSEIDDGAASSIVTADRSVTTASGERPENDIYLRIDLVKTEGTWKIDNVSNLRFTLSGTGQTSTP